MSLGSNSIGFDCRGNVDTTRKLLDKRIAEESHKMLVVRLIASGALTAFVSLSGLAHAEQPVPTGTGSEGTEIQELVVTAERMESARDAPTKASLFETQPQSIITHAFIELATPESGDYTTAILIAPSVTGVSAIGGGVGESNTSTLRGFQDGQYNVTFDGIAFGDSNDLTHHTAAFFPGSAIGAAVVDRGPGAAGDLGSANFGGAIHLFSPVVSDKASASQKLTYGSFNTRSYVTALQSGSVDWLHGTKIFVNLDERSSDGQLSYAKGSAYNQLIKVVVPIKDGMVFTAFSTWNQARYNMPDTGAAMGVGLTADQVRLYGKDFALNNNPYDEHYFAYNNVNKHTSFSYLNLKWEIVEGLSLEDHLYYYWYQNKTLSSQAANDLVNPNPGPQISPSSAPVVYTLPTDIGGYHKGIVYHTLGDIIRLNKDFSFGTLRTGGILEWANTVRYLLNYDFTTGQPDPGIPGGRNGNASYQEDSKWFQYQVFADFEYRPMENLTVTPGVKYYDFNRTINASAEPNGLPASGSREYKKFLYFLTANYRITPVWSVYAQTATALLVPPLKTLAAAGGTVANTEPQHAATYQLGTVYSVGKLTFDLDLYKIHATNVLFNATGSPCKCYRNLGTGDYKGIEGQGAYSFGNGLTLFANGSINRAIDTNPGNGAPPNDFTNAPRGTAAAGVIYHMGSWAASALDKWVGQQLGSDGATWLPSYNTFDASLAYDFGHIRLKLAGFNLANHRSLTDFDGVYYVYQVGREIQFTVEGKL
jgi:iron complex outermembrane receptor protein